MENDLYLLALRTEHVCNPNAKARVKSAECEDLIAECDELAGAYNGS